VLEVRRSALDQNAGRRLTPSASCTVGSARPGLRAADAAKRLPLRMQTFV
jgi:hypothetical protein